MDKSKIEKLRSAYYKHALSPSATRVQSIWRGRGGRQKAAEKKLQQRKAQSPRRFSDELKNRAKVTKAQQRKMQAEIQRSIDELEAVQGDWV